MRTPHKHAEVIKAWADGAQVQWLNPEAGWTDCDGYQPNWSVSNQYRIKPEPRKGWYRVALFRPVPGIGPLQIVFTDGVEEMTPYAEGFIRWLTPRTEYEVECLMSAAERIAEWFQANPDEALLVKDVEVKFTLTEDAALKALHMLCRLRILKATPYNPERLPGRQRNLYEVA